MDLKSMVSNFFLCIVSYTIYAQDAKVVGHIKGLGSKPIIFGYVVNNVYKSDTVTAHNDRFIYYPKLSDDGQIHVRISKPRYTTFWYEPGTLNISGSADKPHRLSYSGGPENAILELYQKKIEWPYEDRKQGLPDSLRSKVNNEEKKDILLFIKNHCTSKTSAYLLYWQTMYDESMVDMYERLYNNLSFSVRSSPQGKAVVKRITTLRFQPVVGKTAPNFTLADTAGKQVSLHAYKGKYILLDFWGHWCGPCIKSFPIIKQLNKRYSDKLITIGIAAEYATDKSIWINTIKSNNLSWIHVSELMADKGEVNMRYNITSFPTYLLLDKNGIILEKANDLSKIEVILSNL